MFFLACKKQLNYTKVVIGLFTSMMHRMPFPFTVLGFSRTGGDQHNRSVECRSLDFQGELELYYSQHSSWFSRLGKLAL